MLSLHSPSAATHWATLRRIYLESFPPEERRPFDDIKRRHSDHSSPLTVLCISDGNEIIGLITWWDFHTFIYIEHFAIDPDHRAGGIGSAAIRRFMDLTLRPIVLEVERPGATPMADRRIAFYRRNGFHPLSGFNYIQPPYSPSLPPVPLLLMSTHPDLPPHQLAATLHSQVYAMPFL